MADSAEWTSADQVAYQWRSGRITLSLWDRISVAIASSGMDAEEVAGVEDLIEKAMLANGGDLYVVDDLPDRVRRLLSL